MTTADDDPPGGVKSGSRGGFLAFWLSLPGVLAAIAALLTAIVAVLTATHLLDGNAPPVPTPCTNRPLAGVATGRPERPAGVIARVGTHGCDVNSSETAEGTVANVPAGQEIWLLVSTGRLYPQVDRLLIGGDGSWTVPVYFGGLGRFTLLLVSTGPEGQKRFRRYIDDGNRTGQFVGIPPSDLPPDVVPLSTISGLVRSA